MEALIGGPWVIADAYLSVSRWRPEFNPKNKRIDSIVAWVRLPDLPAPLFDKNFLLNLGNSTGKAIKLDIHTAQRARGKFARGGVKALDKASSQGMERRSQEGRTEKGTRVNQIIRVSKQGNLGIIKSASLSTAEILKCGPASSLGKYKGRGIQLKDKENLNPGDPMEGERDISAMDMGDMRVVDGIPVSLEALEKCIGEGSYIPASVV
ncbi:hypothetical protein K1719_004817 [Acacia pycnantha]|nr:hypothetical protein K1719_004817 [Acacia pycnantha]